MADERQFGVPKVLGFGERRAENAASDLSNNPPGGSLTCEQVEAMLTDAVDGTLTANEQEQFEGHVAECVACSELVAEARRGAAWLDMLRLSRPEPPAALLERILAQTTGAQDGVASNTSLFVAKGNVIPFRKLMVAAVRESSFAQIMLQPRLAMTAAMAFFSIALTMNLTGVRLQDLRLSELKAGSLKRNFYSANTRVAQYYEGLRVVYEMESRVRDLREDLDDGSVRVPNGAQNLERSPDQPGTRPAAKPGLRTIPPAQRRQEESNPPERGPADRNKPDGASPDDKGGTIDPGTSRREELYPSRRLVADERMNENIAGELTNTSRWSAGRWKEQYGDSARSTSLRAGTTTRWGGLA